MDLLTEPGNERDDDGQAIDVQLEFPSDVAVTADGGPLIADIGNDIVRAVSAV